MVRVAEAPAGNAEGLLAWAESIPSGASALIGGDELAAYDQLARLLSLRGMTQYAECRLRPPHQLDLLVAFDRSVDTHALLELVDQRTQMSDGEARATWSTVQAFVQRWAARADPAAARVSTIWFEFDNVLRAHAIQATHRLSACLLSDYDRSWRPGHPCDRPAEASVVEEVYRALAGAAASGETAALLRRATMSLPEGGRFIYVSLMGARDPSDAKLYGAVPRSELGRYLRRVEWSGPLDRVETLLARLAAPDPLGHSVFFDLNVCNMHRPSHCTLGVAFSQQQVGTDPRRTALLEGLVAEGHCSLDQAALLRSWATGSPTAGRRGRVSRWLDIKTVVGPGPRIQSKAYLGFRSSPSPFAIGH